jgi:hypothetical protein
MVVRLYADRIPRRRNAVGQWWSYVGLVAIPEKHCAHALDRLEQGRAAGGYWGEIHFVELKSSCEALHGAKTAVARQWVDTVLGDEEKVFHFHLLGLNLSNLQPSAFGRGARRRRNIYNRFFRSAVAYTLKAFFGSGRPIRVSQIFHDKDEMEADDLFDWHTIWKISSAEDGIAFDTERIYFVDSDHEKEPELPQESHFIQLADVLTGGISQCLDATSTRAGSCEVARCLLPLIERLTDRKRVSNRNSRFRHVGRLSLAFFPSKKLSASELEDPIQRARSGFYIERPLLLQQRTSGQLPLAL